MVDFPFGRCSKRCQIQNRPLLPGERYYSVAIPSENANGQEGREDGVIRYDVSASAWTGPPKHAIGWWANEMPRAEQARVRPAKPIELLDRLSALCDDPSEAELASLFATLLVRRRILVPHPVHESENSSTAEDDCPEGFTEYTHRGTNSHFRVPSIEPVSEDQQSLHLRLQQLLVVEVDSESLDEQAAHPPSTIAPEESGELSLEAKSEPVANAIGSGLERDAGSTGTEKLDAAA
jgi:hypothetical protein